MWNIRKNQKRGRQDRPNTWSDIGRNKTCIGVHKDNSATQTMFLGKTCGEKSEARANKNKKQKHVFLWFHQRGTSHSLGWFGLFFVAKNVIPNTPHINSNRKKTNKHRRTQGKFCNTDDVLRAKMWREIAKKSRKNSVCCDSTSKVPHAVWAVFGGKIRFWTPQNSTERPQDRPDNRKPDANIGCTVGVVYKRDGSKNQKEARRKTQTLGTFGESWGASGEPFGETWGRLWGDSESVFLTKHAWFS